VSTQHYGNHVHRPLPTAIAGMGWLLALVGFVSGWLGYAWGPSVGAAGLLVAVASLVATSRLYTTRLQDRIIHLEEQLRAERLLSAAQRARWQRLSQKHVAALRFASDDEFATLLDRVVDEGMSADAIKRAVTAWRADHNRT